MRCDVVASKSKQRSCCLCVGASVRTRAVILELSPLLSVRLILGLVSIVSVTQGPLEKKRLINNFLTHPILFLQSCSLGLMVYVIKRSSNLFISTCRFRASISFK